MAQASGVDVRISAGAVPLLPGVVDLADKGLIPGGTRRNLAWVTDHLDATGLSERDVLVLADAQTSGGLLFGVASDAEAVAGALRASGHDAAVIGQVTGHGDGRITATP
jgi:selenide,water dikinase